MFEWRIEVGWLDEFDDDGPGWQDRAAAITEEKAIARRIATVESENRRLRRSLEEAEQKLDAITTIERSLREQANTGESQN